MITENQFCCEFTFQQLKKGNHQMRPMGCSSESIWMLLGCHKSVTAGRKGFSCFPDHYFSIIRTETLQIPLSSSEGRDVLCHTGEYWGGQEEWRAKRPFSPFLALLLAFFLSVFVIFIIIIFIEAQWGNWKVRSLWTAALWGGGIHKVLLPCLSLDVAIFGGEVV